MAEIKIYGKLKNATESGKVADYSEIDGVPIVEQDLTASGFTPVANTYYKHTGATSATYTQGVIYLYNGTEYKAIDGSGTGGGNPTNGFYPYNAVVSSAPTVGSTYSYDDSNVTYPTGCEYFQGQMIIDANGVIYKVTGSTMCECVYIPSSGGSATFPAVDLTNATVPGSGEFTNEQADLLYYVNNKASFIMIQDTIGGLATYIVLPLVSLDSIHNYYTYKATVEGNTYILYATLQKTTGDVWGVKTYTINKAAAAGGSKVYQHTMTFQYTTSTNTYNVYITLINSYSESFSLTPFLNTYGLNPLWGYWGGFKQDTGTIATTLIKLAATSSGFKLTTSSNIENDATLVSDDVKEV